MKLVLLLAAVPLTAPLTTAPAPPPAQDRPQPRPKTAPARTKPLVAYGAKADSLDGIPGHHFGEPRSNFPELEARGFNNLDGYVSYSPREDQPAPGWFGKHADQVRCTYWFRDDRFAGFTARQTAPDGQRQLLAGEASYLLGKGRLVSTYFGQATTRWQGRQVLAEYVDGHGEAALALNSQAVLAQVAAEKRARQQTEAAARAASLKTDNAGPVRQTP